MKVSGHSMNHSYSHQAKTFFDDSQLVHESGLPCVGDVYVTNTFIDYGNQTECFRPSIVLTGRLLNIKGQFPNDINMVEFDEKDQPGVTLHYGLTNEQIAKMYTKGIFPDRDQLAQFVSDKEDGFISYPETVVTSSIMNDNIYEELPITCSYLMVKDTDVPVIFVQPESQYNINIDLSCGYELTEYLEPFKYVAAERKVVHEVEEEHVTEIHDNTIKKPLMKNLTPEAESVATDIFNITKPRVDEHIEQDNAHLEEVNRIVESMREDDFEGDDVTYESEFERMMKEDVPSSEQDVSDEVHEDTADDLDTDKFDFNGPLSMEQVIERKRRQEKARNAVKQNEELNKTMPSNLDDIKYDTESDKQAGE